MSAPIRTMEDCTEALTTISKRITVVRGKFQNSNVEISGFLHGILIAQNDEELTGHINNILTKMGHCQQETGELLVALVDNQRAFFEAARRLLND